MALEVISGQIIDEKLPEKTQALPLKGHEHEQGQQLNPLNLHKTKIFNFSANTAMNITEVDSAFRP